MFVNEVDTPLDIITVSAANCNLNNKHIITVKLNPLWLSQQKVDIIIFVKVAFMGELLYWTAL